MNMIAVYGHTLHRAQVIALWQQVFGSRRIPGLVLAGLLQACVMVPVTTERYNPECRQVARQMTLQPMQVAAITGCVNNGCAVLLAAAGVTAAASTVVSGTIAIVGNVVYWMEEQGRCLRTRA